MVKQYGLGWKEVLFGSEPYWTVEPKSDVIESIVRKHLTIEPDGPCQVHFYTQGAFNKLYKVDTDKGTFLMRVSLPVDPHYKTTSEIATIDYVREEIGIPVPGIIAFDESSDNDLDFEWILMELMPGQPLRRKWRKMSMEAKEELVKQLASYQAKLFEKRFDGIGSLYNARKEEPAGPHGVDYAPKSSFTLGRIVSMIFFWGDHLSHDIPRGPFRNSHDWLHARLTLTITDQERILKESNDEDEIEDAENAKDAAQRLLKLLPNIFPPTEPVESTILFHDDLSRQNILVDESGKLTGIVDWECVSTLPLWRACQIPHLLEGRNRYEKPQRESYSTEQPTTSGDYEDPDADLDNEGINPGYWEHLLEYEQTQLRDLFISEMGRLQPLWLEVAKMSTLKADFEIAVHNSDVWGKLIWKWLNAYDSGEPWSLRERFLE
ncbi:hypothetical protein FQN55_006542 [Onygenales sp. PD_40]|nr:hypothetical protein FQN55_006542 [Onygenales sp. PD_40]KAK2798103.1 hypothetical protein FQN51_007922 [Onygenales sp. PD_10]